MSKNLKAAIVSIIGYVASDLERSTVLAIEVEQSHGIGQCPLRTASSLTGSTLRARHRDCALMSAVDVQLREQLRRARQIISKDKSTCKVLHASLMETEILDGRDAMRAIVRQDQAR